MNSSVSTPVVDVGTEPMRVTCEMSIQLLASEEWSASLYCRVPELSQAWTFLLKWDENQVLQQYSGPGDTDDGLPQQAINLLRANGIHVPAYVGRQGRPGLLS